MEFPAIHLNGTSAAGLMNDYLAALTSLYDAVQALQRAAPNGRDYYVVGPDAYGRARKEHEQRLHRLADNIFEIRAICESVNDQQDAREAAMRGAGRSE